MAKFTSKWRKITSLYIYVYTIYVYYTYVDVIVIFVRNCLKNYLNNIKMYLHFYMRFRISFLFEYEQLPMACEVSFVFYTFHIFICTYLFSCIHFDAFSYSLICGTFWRLWIWTNSLWLWCPLPLQCSVLTFNGEAEQHILLQIFSLEDGFDFWQQLDI